MNVDFFISICLVICGCVGALAFIITANHIAIRKEYRWERDCVELSCLGCENCEGEK